jgi:replicative DNA helicase
LSRPGKEAYDEQGVPRMPRLDDLRDSGGLEQDADVVGFIHRPEFYMRQQGRDCSKVEGQALYSQAKNREGVVDTTMLGFHGELMTFSEPWWTDWANDDGAKMTAEEIA